MLSISMFHRFGKAGCIKKYSLSSLKTITCGGALIKPEIQKELKSILPHTQILQGYGKYTYNAIKY